MLIARLLPRQADNNYHGHKAALWLLGLFLLMKVGIAIGSIFNGHDAASVADGIPLDTFTPAGAHAIVTLFALLGIAILMMCLMGILVLFRYRALVPLMFAIFILEHLSRKLALLLLPIEREGGSSGSIVNLVILVILVAGLGLSLWKRGGSAQ
jgi:hypothetical protein